MYILWIMFAYLLLYVFRLVLGPSVWDRLLAVNLVHSKIVLIAVLYASFTDTAFLLDFAIIFALFGFIGTIFTALFLAERRRSGGK